MPGDVDWRFWTWRHCLHCPRQKLTPLLPYRDILTQLSGDNIKSSRQGAKIQTEVFDWCSKNKSFLFLFSDKSIDKYLERNLFIMVILLLWKGYLSQVLSVFPLIEHLN